MTNRVYKIGALATLAAAGLIASLFGFASGASASASHVTICHRTGSHSNPYVVISPSASGVYHGHYTEHNENAVFPNTASDGKWGDIIPPFSFNGHTYSLNWNSQGQAIFNNSCHVPSSSTTTTTTTTGTTTTPATTTIPGSTVTVTTPGSTVTTTTPGQTVTMPGTTTTKVKTRTKVKTKIVYRHPKKFIFTR